MVDTNRHIAESVAKRGSQVSKDCHPAVVVVDDLYWTRHSAMMPRNAGD
jgi:hypothetical protein